ncbi:hypothetical protein LINPERPRIM_LOCUS37325, partial [Linum perenne]
IYLSLQVFSFSPSLSLLFFSLLLNFNEEEGATYFIPKRVSKEFTVHGHGQLVEMIIWLLFCLTFIIFIRRPEAMDSKLFSET